MKVPHTGFKPAIENTVSKETVIDKDSSFFSKEPKAAAPEVEEEDEEVPERATTPVRSTS